MGEESAPRTGANCSLLVTHKPADDITTKAPIFSNTKIERSKYGCKGYITYAPLSIAKDKKFPLYMVVRNQGAINRPEDLMALDKEVAIDGVKYQLGMVNLWDKHKNEPFCLTALGAE